MAAPVGLGGAPAFAAPEGLGGALAPANLAGLTEGGLGVEAPAGFATDPPAVAAGAGLSEGGLGVEAPAGLATDARAAGSPDGLPDGTLTSVGLRAARWATPADDSLAAGIDRVGAAPGAWLSGVLVAGRGGTALARDSLARAPTLPGLAVSSARGSCDATGGGAFERSGGAGGVIFRNPGRIGGGGCDGAGTEGRCETAPRWGWLPARALAGAGAGMLDRAQVTCEGGGELGRNGAFGRELGGGGLRVDGGGSLTSGAAGVAPTPMFAAAG